MIKIINIAIKVLIISGVIGLLIGVYVLMELMFIR